MRRLLLTGSTGFIGSHLADRALASHVPVAMLCRRQSALPAAWAAAGATIVAGDLHHEQALAEAADGVDTVVHLAGTITALSRADMFRTNVDGTQRLLRACDRKGIHFVHVSSQAAAGPGAPGASVDETCTPAPISWYGESKLAAEQRVSEWAERTGNRATILRPSVVYGPRDRALLPLFRLAKRGFLPVPGTGVQAFSITCVDDLVAAIFRLIGSAGTTAGTNLFFVAGDEYVSWPQWADALGAAFGRTVRPVRVPGWALGLAAVVAELVGRLRGRAALLNRQKLRELSQRSWLCRATRLRDCGWVPEHPLVQGIRETVQWYRDEHWL